MKTTEQIMLKSQEGKKFHLTKCILKTNSAFQPKCTVVRYLYLSLTLHLDSPEFQNPSQNIRDNRRIHSNRFVLRIVQTKGNILLMISKKTSITYSDLQVLKDKILTQANEIIYENHLFRKFHVPYFFKNVLSSHMLFIHSQLNSIMSVRFYFY